MAFSKMLKQPAHRRHTSEVRLHFTSLKQCVVTGEEEQSPDFQIQRGSAVVPLAPPDAQCCLHGPHLPAPKGPAASTPEHPKQKGTGCPGHCRVHHPQQKVSTSSYHCITSFHITSVEVLWKFPLLLWVWTNNSQWANSQFYPKKPALLLCFYRTGVPSEPAS